MLERGGAITTARGGTELGRIVGVPDARPFAP